MQNATKCEIGLFTWITRNPPHSTRSRVKFPISNRELCRNLIFSAFFMLPSGNCEGRSFRSAFWYCLHRTLCMFPQNHAEIHVDFSIKHWHCVGPFSKNWKFCQACCHAKRLSFFQQCRFCSKSFKNAAKFYGCCVKFSSLKTYSAALWCCNAGAVSERSANDFAMLTELDEKWWGRSLCPFFLISLIFY